MALENWSRYGPDEPDPTWRDEWPVVALCLAMAGILIGGMVVILYHTGRWAWTTFGG